MRVASVIGFSPYWTTQLQPWTLDVEEGPTCGGGEEAGLRTAQALRRRGHDVEVWWYGQGGEWSDIKFNSLTDPLYQRLVGEPWDAVIAWSTLAPLEWAPRNAVRVFAQQLNDLAIVGDWKKVDMVVSPSASHSEKVREWQWAGPRAVVHNGVHAPLYEEQLLTPWEERPLTVGYWSSPDRGLHHLLRAWPEIHAAVPEARLHVFYEINRFMENLMQVPIGFYGERGMQLYKLLLKARADPSIVFEGHVTRVALARFQRQCRVMCFPLDVFNYTEGFSNATCQGLAAGCHVLVRPLDALPSLYQDGPTWLDKVDTTDFAFPSYVAGEVIAVLKGPGPNPKSRLTGLAYTWERSGYELDAALHDKRWVRP